MKEGLFGGLGGLSILAQMLVECKAHDQMICNLHYISQYLPIAPTPGPPLFCTSNWSAI